MRDPFAAFSAYSVTDPALSFESDEKRAEFEKTRDPALCKIKDGCKPCLFTVQPCSAECALWLDSIPSPVERSVLAFRACVHRIALPDGEVLDAEVYEANVGSLAKKEWVETAAKRVGPKRIREFGELAYARSMLEDFDPLSQQPGQPPQS